MVSSLQGCLSSVEGETQWPLDCQETGGLLNQLTWYNELIEIGDNLDEVPIHQHVVDHCTPV